METLEKTHVLEDEYIEVKRQYAKAKKRGKKREIDDIHWQHSRCYSKLNKYKAEYESLKKQCGYESAEHSSPATSENESGEEDDESEDSSSE